jgi:uncharacterized protein YdeI (YjbR/CyaY-like superfamily)
MQKFSAIIKIIGVNPYVSLPDECLRYLQEAVERDKGPIPVKGNLNGKPFIQTVVKYAGEYRLYLNTPMRQATNTTVGDKVTVELDIDNDERAVPIPNALFEALSKNKLAKEAFDKLPPSRQKEINRYIGFLKSEEAINKNVEKVISFLGGKKTEGVLFR